MPRATGNARMNARSRTKAPRNHGFTRIFTARKETRATPPIGTAARRNRSAVEPLDEEWLSIVNALLR